MESSLFELDMGKLIVLHSSSEKKQIPHQDKLYIKKLNETESLVINSFKDKCIIMPTSDIENGVGGDILELFDTQCNESYVPLSSTDYSDFITFILAITYQCNMQCSYCYQRNAPELHKQLISEENLNYILSIIQQYMERHPNKKIAFGLFGGEPLLPQNKAVIEKIMSFCLKKGIPIQIISNGSYLEFYLKELIIHRRIISSVAVTIDSVKLNYITRRTAHPNECETENLIKCLRTLMNYGINVVVSTNIDRHNMYDIFNMREDFKELGFLSDPHFSWSIGRVDDRLHETGYPDIVMESQIIELLLGMEFQSNIFASFIKTSFNLLGKMGKSLNQLELRGLHNYCWVSSTEDNVFYIDNDLKTYRCTYTVGRPKFSLFNFSLSELEKYTPINRTAAMYEECSNCPIGGYCGGGCQLSRSVNPEETCRYERASFDYFIDHILIPFIHSVRRKNEEKS